MIHNYKISDNVESKRESLRCLDYVDTLEVVVLFRTREVAFGLV